jgi:hypothetical protein
MFERRKVIDICFIYKLMDYEFRMVDVPLSPMVPSTSALDIGVNGPCEENNILQALRTTLFALRIPFIVFSAICVIVPHTLFEAYARLH